MKEVAAIFDVKLGLEVETSTSSLAGLRSYRKDQEDLIKGAWIYGSILNYFGKLINIQPAQYFLPGLRDKHASVHVFSVFFLQLYKRYISMNGDNLPLAPPEVANSFTSLISFH